MLRSLLILCLALFAFSCSSKTTIINSVGERDANEIVVFLAAKGIDAERIPAPSSGALGGAQTEQMWNIQVDPQNVVDAMALLSRAGLPRKQGQDLLSLFGETGLVPTDMQQKIRYQAGLSEQIANTIRKIDGVLDAAVQISIPPDDSTQPITASVYVKHSGVLDNPNSQLISKIKQLVAGSVAGLKIENVTVIADKARYADSPQAADLSAQEQDKEMVTIWGINVWRSSLGMFQLVFFALCFIILLLLIVLGWVVWRVFPLLHEKGGVSFLLRDEKPKDENPPPPPPSNEPPPPPAAKP